MTSSCVAVFISIFGCLSIISFDCRWLISITAYAENIPEDCSVCGIRLKIYGDISEGESAPENASSYPWMVSIGYSYYNTYCLGAIIDEFHILTAAHCVTNNERDVRIYNRVHFRTKPRTGLNFGSVIDKVIIHPRYRLIDSESTGVTIATHDIALVKLKERIKCNEYQNPICLPPADFKLPLGARNIYTGWNFSHPGLISRSTKLRSGFIKNLKFRKCIKGVPEARMIKHHMLCQGETEHNMCYGDSGGPLMNKINGIYYIVGIASSETNEICSLNKPMIFTNVVKFLEWIQKKKKTTFSFPRDNINIPSMHDANDTETET